MKTYANIPESFSRKENSKIVLLPVPYDGTSTWQKGADQGPQAFLEASENMELYDIETASEVYKQGIYLAPAITENSSAVLFFTKYFGDHVPGGIFVNNNLLGRGNQTMVQSPKTAYGFLVGTCVKKSDIEGFLIIKNRQMNRIDMLFTVVIIVAVASETSQ